MRFFYLIVFICLAGITTLVASPKDTIATKRVAINFYASHVSHQTSTHNIHATLAYVGKAPSRLRGDSVECFRIYNIDGGFVIVTTDDRLEPVLGYSTEGNFQFNQIPDVILEFLNDYKTEIIEVLSESTSRTSQFKAKWNALGSDRPIQTRTGTVVIPPLLTTTWDQNSYYNNLCPVDASGPNGHAYAGCVATAMAQIIRYWQYPSHGIGSHTYTANFSSLGYGDYGNQTVNFANSSYDYSNMPSSISGSSSAEQIFQVAQLSYHCGVSVDMQYGPGGSGATSSNAANALNSYFGYSGCYHRYRSSYSDNDWIALLKSELNNLRPLLYHGNGSGGHAFVCDGYDSDNYFHFNWGWSGSYNGYYLISGLTPGSHNFNSTHGAVLGINASIPIIRPNTDRLFFLVETGTISEGKPISILTHSLPAPISATATGNFQISTDSIHYSTTLSLSSSGGTLYVRYQPTSSDGTERGFLYLTSGNTRDTISLVGSSYSNTCLPPENLSISSQDLQHISIRWDKPDMDTVPQTLSWSSDYINFSSGYPSDYKVTILQRFCDTDLVALHGRSLTSIDFYAKSGVTTYKVVVYKGGTYDGNSYNPGDLVLTQNININSLSLSGWNTITLNTPVVIDAHQELWFGIYLEAPGGTYTIPINNNSAPTKGCIRGYHSGNSVSWDQLYPSAACIKGGVTNMNSITNYQIFRNETLIGTTTSLAAQDVVNNQDTYLYSVTANWTNGCSASVQTYYTNVPYLHASPEALDFYTNYGYSDQTKTVTINVNGINTSIQATANGPFHISTDAVNFSTSTVLPNTGGILYVRYIPTSTSTPYETGAIHLVSGSLSQNITLTGQCFRECNPPRNLTLSENGNNVSMNWEAPSDPILQQSDLTWCSSHSYNYGSSANVKRYLMYRFEASDLTPYRNKHIKSISFIPHSAATTYKLIVYKGGSYDGSTYNAGNLVVEQNVVVSSLTPNTWNTVNLNNPVSIDPDQELWYGIYIEVPANNYAISMGTPYVPHKGCITRSATYSYSSWSEYQSDKSFVLKAALEDDMILLANYQIDRNDDSINVTTNTTYNDYVTYNGLYHYTTWAVWNNGCKAAVRESVAISGLIDFTGTSVIVDTCNTFTWQGEPYTSSGTYYYNYVDALSNPLTDTLHLTINHPTTGDTNAVACDSFDWYEHTGITTSGDYTHTFVGGNVHGCDSTVTLHLTINHPTSGDTSAVACGSFDWYEHTGITTSGTYTHIFVGGNANGCDSTVTLHLTINQPTTGDTNAVACGSFDWYEHTGITTSGTYTHIFVGGNANGCDSTVTLHLTINQPSTGDTNAVACGSFDWYEHFGITTSGDYTHTFVGGNANGCDSTVTLHLTINQPTSGDTNAVACGSFDWYEYPGITTSGDYTHTFVGGNANGCDSTVTLHLTINQPTTGDTNAVACGSFDWYEYKNITASTSSLTHTFINANGCDSVVTLHLTINNPTNTDTVAEAVETFVWHRTGAADTTITTSGIYTHTHPDANGCAQTDTLHLTVYHATGTQIDTSACESFVWHRTLAGDTIITSSGTYVDNLTDVHGADSVITLVLTINHGATSASSVAECFSYMWHDTTYTESGSYIFEYINSVGCPSADTLHLVINIPVNTDTTAEAVEAFVWHRAGATDTIITTSGIYTHTHPDANGCAQTDTLHLTVYHATGTQIDTSACESFVWHRPLAGDTTITSSGTYIDNLTDVHGADSVITLVITINPSYYFPENVTVMEAQLPYLWHGQTFNENATAFDSLSTVAGCDSVFYLNLTVVPYNIIQDNPIALCQGETQLWRGHLLSEQGSYSDTVPAENTIYTVEVTVNPTYYFPENVTVMQAQLPYLWHGQTFYESATAFDSLSTLAGCDSVFYLNLTVTSFTIIQDNPIALCQGETQLWRGHLISEQGSYNDTVLVENTIYMVDVTVNPTYYFPENVTVMEAQLPYLWHGQTFNESATAFDSLSTVAGCDSVFYLNLTVIPFNIIQDNPIALCQGETQLWHGQLLSEQGSYSDTVTAENTIYTVEVSVNPTYYFPENVTVMQAELPYQWHGQTFNESATAFDSLLTVAGCDSVFYLNLTVTTYTIIQDNPIALCQGETQLWRGHLLSEQGSYNDTVLVENTIYMVDVTVNPTYYFPENVTVMEAQLPYIWHGQTFNESATAFDSLSTLAGCDSVFYLNLTVVPYNTIQENPIALCQGETQDWHGQLISEQGSYSDTVSAENTIYTVEVTVNPTYYFPENVTVMQAQLPYIWHGQTFYESATAFDSLSTLAGCDSVFYLNLTVTTFTIVQDNPIALCQGETQLWLGHLLSEQGSYSDTVLVENTIYMVDVTVNPTYYFPENVTVMEAQLPYLWHGQTFNESATAFDSLSTVAGCDSVFYLNLTVIPFNIIQDNPIALCQGETQLWRGHLLSEQGSYSDTIAAENTIYTVAVSVNPTYYFPEDVTVSQTQLPFHWHGQTFNESATAFDSLLTVAGCDSIFYLNLTVTIFTIVQDNPIALCQGETQLWRGHLLSAQGSYSDTALAESIIYMVEVTVSPTYYIPENVAVTQAQLPYQWHGQTFNESATAFDSLLTVAGCDSIFYLNLSVLPFNIIYDNPIALCQGETQLWRGHLLSEQGTYNDTALVENIIYTVEVTVNPTYVVDTAVIITTNDLPYHFVSGQIDTTFSTLTSQFSVFTFPLSTTEGCDSIVTLHITLNVGIENHTAEFIRAFPNPTTGHLTVIGSEGLTQLQLFDAYGRRVCVYPVEGTQTEIDLHGLASGVYFLKAMRHNQTAGTLKIIKNNE